jgi:hypothetical protein
MHNLRLLWGAALGLLIDFEHVGKTTVLWLPRRGARSIAVVPIITAAAASRSNSVLETFVVAADVDGPR